MARVAGYISSCPVMKTRPPTGTPPSQVPVEMVKGPRLDAPKGSRLFEDPDLSFWRAEMSHFFLGLLLSHSLHSMPDVVLSIAVEVTL